MPFIILDRDGVINYDSEEYIKTPEEWLAIPGSLKAIAALNRSGFKVLIATNQSGIARGYYDLATLNRIHEKMLAELSIHGGVIEDIFFCPHHPLVGCDCRKPRPGLLLKMRDKHFVNLGETFFIGDSHVDVNAALNAGCKPLLVLTGKGEKTLQKYPELIRVPNFYNLASAVEYVLSNTTTKKNDETELF